jgi:hypothetical protein
VTFVAVVTGSHARDGEYVPKTTTPVDAAMSSNPFSATLVTNQRGVFGGARRLRSGFLFRVIELESPFPCRLVYDGWWFRQKIEVNDQLAWFQISWLTIRRRVEFAIPASVDATQPPARIEIEFGRGLSIRRFRVWIDGQIAYDEVN